MAEFDPLVSTLLRIGAGLYLAAMVAFVVWLGIKFVRAVSVSPAPAQPDILAGDKAMMQRFWRNHYSLLELNRRTAQTTSSTTDYYSPLRPYGQGLYRE